MHRLSRRAFLLGSSAGALVLRSGYAHGERRIVLNDASGLNPTPVARHWIASRDDEAQFAERLRLELKEAAAARRPVAVGAARHSMGGQSLPRNGTAIDLPSALCLPDAGTRTYRVHAGARWRDVVRTLDPIGFSPAVMQSNHDFGVASTFSVNAHGWPVPFGPFGSTVRSFRLMLADGTILSCSRSENPELFSLCMGGYGLFGVILDLEVAMVPNASLKPVFQVLPSAELAPHFLAAVNAGAVQMAYARLSVAKRRFLEEALLVTFEAQPTPPASLPPGPSQGPASSLTRQIYRAQIGWETGKQVRWLAETLAAPSMAPGLVTRNTLLNAPVAHLANADKGRTDILHEYFVAPERFGDFVKVCQEVIPRHRQDLLNITLRYVGEDTTSTLAYAPTRRIAAVMSFSQEMTPGAEADMIGLTEELVDRVVALGGSFYLPYRLHARPDQVAAAYPGHRRFLEGKRHYDPGALFRNHLWDAYFT